MGMKLEQYTSDGLLSKLKNVDAVLDGHTHLIYNTTTKDMNSKDIHISQTGTKLQSIGKLIIKNDGKISSEIIQAIPEPSDKTNATKLSRGGKDVWVNKDMNNFINDI
jgi:2',3'-cyclic-nucleotide 2'-phosphodiesterase (5'-nucleotidase family)